MGRKQATDSWMFLHRSDFGVNGLHIFLEWQPNSYSNFPSICAEAMKFFFEPTLTELGNSHVLYQQDGGLHSDLWSQQDRGLHSDVLYNGMGVFIHMARRQTEFRRELSLLHLTWVVSQWKQAQNWKTWKKRPETSGGCISVNPSSWHAGLLPSQTEDWASHLPGSRDERVSFWSLGGQPQPIPSKIYGYSICCLSLDSVSLEV